MYSNSQMDEWFNLKPESFRKHRREKLKELEKFCSFELPKRGYVLVVEVYCPIYYKKNDRFIQEIKQISANKYKGETIVSNRNTADDLMVAQDLYPKKPTKNKKTGKMKTLRETQLNSLDYRAQIVSEVVKEDWGDPNTGVAGVKGWCEYIWCRGIKELDDMCCKKFDFLDEEDIEFAEECWRDCAKEKSKREQEKKIIEDALNEAELSDEEFGEKYRKLIKDVFRQQVYLPMAEHLQLKYHDRWIYVRAILLHEFPKEEENLFEE